MPAEFNQLDTQAFQSINGDLGGVWAPSGAAITIGGLGLVVSGPFHLSGAFAIFDGAVTLNDGIGVYGSSAFYDHLSIYSLVVQTTTEFVGSVLFDTDTTFNSGNLDFFGSQARFHSGTTFQAIGDVILGNASGGDITINGNVTANEALTVDGAALFTAAARFNDIVDFWGTDVTLHTNTALHCNGTVSLNGAVTLGDSSGDIVTINGTTAFNAAVVANSTLEVWGNTSIHSGGYFHALGDSQLGNAASNVADVRATMTLHAPMQFADSGRLPKRPIIGSNTGRSYSVTDANVIYVPASGLSGSVAYSISDTGAQDGDEFFVRTDDVNHLLFIQPPTGAALAVQSQLGYGAWAYWMRIAGTWRQLQSLTELP